MAFVGLLSFRALSRFATPTIAAAIAAGELKQSAMKYTLCLALGLAALAIAEVSGTQMFDGYTADPLVNCKRAAGL
jgi:hypothetical protein